MVLLFEVCATTISLLPQKLSLNILGLEVLLLLWLQSYSEVLPRCTMGGENSLNQVKAFSSDEEEKD